MEKEKIKNIGIILGCLIFLWLIFGLIWFNKLGIIDIFHTHTKVADSALNNSNFQEEIAYLNDHPNFGFGELQKYFQDIANKKGARYAYGLLKVAQLPPNIDLHLMGHAVGDILYKQEGLEGITDCTNDFRNACSHSIVQGLFFDKGENALPDIAAACRKAPGGSGAYTMCFHGLGHGILAFEGYDMTKASVMCQKTGTPEYNFNESSQCISGAVMEIISGGFHDHETWQKQRDKTLNKYRPLGLCMSNNVPEAAKPLCYNYLTPFLWEAAGGDIQHPTPEIFAKSFKFCNQIPVSQVTNRDSCYGGFGKEFDGIVQSRDIRLASMVKISDEALKQIYTWCGLADNADGVFSCANQAMGSLYWGGENDKSIAIRFCNLIPKQGDKNKCFSNLIGSAFFYVKDQGYRQNFCEALPAEYQQDCYGKLGQNNP